MCDRIQNCQEGVSASADGWATKKGQTSHPHLSVCVRVHAYETSHNIGFLCIKRDDKVCRRCTWVNP